MAEPPDDRPALHVLESGKNDHQRAQDYKARLRPLLESAGAIVDEARREDMRIEFGMGTDAFGRCVIQRLDVVKIL